jgi:hypothetical protein
LGENAFPSSLGVVFGLNFMRHQMANWGGPLLVSRHPNWDIIRDCAPKSSNRTAVDLEVVPNHQNNETKCSEIVSTVRAHETSSY